KTVASVASRQVEYDMAASFPLGVLFEPPFVKGRTLPFLKAAGAQRTAKEAAKPPESRAGERLHPLRKGASVLGTLDSGAFRASLHKRVFRLTFSALPTTSRPNLDAGQMAKVLPYWRRGSAPAATDRP